MGYPVDEPFVTCKYDQKGNAWRCGRHTGVDFKAAKGTEVMAIEDGKVTYMGRNGGWGPSYGLHIIVQNGDHRVVYAHLSRLDLAALKDKKVSEGDVIGYSGSTGHSTGPHLHVEARKFPYRYDKDAINPMPLITGEPEPDDAPKPAKKAATKPVKAKSDETI